MRPHRVSRRRLVAALTTCVLVAGLGVVAAAGGATAQETTVDGVTSSAPSITMISGRKLERRGDRVDTTTDTAIVGDFTLEVAERTTFSEVRLALRSTAVAGDSYDAGRQYDVTVSRSKSFTAKPVVPDGKWTAAALWLKNGRWNSGPWTSFTVSGGMVVVDPQPSTDSGVALPTASPTASPTATPTSTTGPTSSPSPSTSPTTSPSPSATPAPSSPAPTTSPTPAPSSADILRSSSFDNGSLTEWDLGGANVAPNPGAQVVPDSTRAYDGTASGRAAIPAGVGNKYARTIWGNSSQESGAMSYGEGSEVWYGMALYLPAGFHSSMQSYFVPMRWDNWGVSNASRTGLSMWDDGSLRLMRSRDGMEGEVNLLGSTTFRLAEQRWHWLEVHQRFSATDGRALNEVYIDGVRLASSTTRNYYGQPLSALRYGIVALSGSAQTLPLTLWYDRATVSRSQVGPRR